MKVLMLIDNLTSGGKERRFVELLKWLNMDKCPDCEVVILSTKIHYKEIFDFRFKIHLLPRKSKRDLSIFLKLYNICKVFKPDIIHSWESMPSIYAIPSVLFLKIRLVNAMIAFAPSKLKPFSKLWMRSKLTFPFSHKIVSNSLAGLESFNVPGKKAICIHNGFNDARMLNIVGKESILAKFDIRTDFVVGMVGAFSPRKDYKTFLNAAELILSKNIPITFITVGSGEDLEPCKDLVLGKHRSNIIFAGLQTDVESIINIFDIGILTTNQKVHGEGISNSILEYMALGKPVIATKGGGTGEIVIDGKTGFIIEPQNPEKLAERIIFLFENRPIASEMGKQGRLRIKNSFSINKMAEAYLNLYNNLSINSDQQFKSAIYTD